MKYLHLDCLIQSDFKDKYCKCLIDTGFDGSLIINEKLAQTLQLTPLVNKVSKTYLGDGKAVLTRLTKLNFSLNSDYFVNTYQVVAVILPQDIECIIGTELLEAVCRAQKTNVQLNYVSNTVDFLKIS
jgi:predicted aspartyl protease